MPDCFSKFNGMWAIAIYDQVEKQVIFSRDRFGIKPLYYRKDADGIRFGSELKQLLHKENPVNKHIVIESLLTSIDNHNEETYFKGIYSFPQSCFGIYNLKTDEFKCTISKVCLFKTLGANMYLLKYQEMNIFDILKILYGFMYPASECIKYLLHFL